MQISTHRPAILKPRIILCIVVLALGAIQTFAQKGGKAEPLRIKFATGRHGITLTGALSNGQEMEYVFAAKKGQTVTIRNSKTGLFDFRVFSDESNFETEFESSPTLTFEIPETGDYNFFVRKKMVKTPRTAHFSITLFIR